MQVGECERGLWTDKALGGVSISTCRCSGAPTSSRTARPEPQTRPETALRESLGRAEVLQRVARTGDSSPSSSLHGPDPAGSKPLLRPHAHFGFSHIKMLRKLLLFPSPPTYTHAPACPDRYKSPGVKSRFVQEKFQHFCPWRSRAFPGGLGMCVRERALCHCALGRAALRVAFLTCPDKRQFGSSCRDRPQLSCLLPNTCYST